MPSIFYRNKHKPLTGGGYFLFLHKTVPKNKTRLTCRVLFFIYKTVVAPITLLLLIKATKIHVLSRYNQKGFHQNQDLMIV